MARPQSITDEQILDAARDVFLEHGIQAPTSAIAEQAGISEGTIFRRYETKEKLFQAAMGIPHEPEWFAQAEQLEEHEDVEEALTELGFGMIEFFSDMIPKMSMLMSCGASGPQMFEGNADAPPIRAIRTLTRFFAAHQRAGRLKNFDPEIAARMFLGSIFHFCFSECVGINQFAPMPERSYVRGVVDTILRGTASQP
ncbi:MAG: TetR/AcrR family transcriptional regulator [Myxococcota bacterium]